MLCEQIEIFFSQIFCSLFSDYPTWDFEIYVGDNEELILPSPLHPFTSTSSSWVFNIRLLSSLAIPIQKPKIKLKFNLIKRLKRKKWKEKEKLLELTILSKRKSFMLTSETDWDSRAMSFFAITYRLKLKKQTNKKF